MTLPNAIPVVIVNENGSPVVVTGGLTEGDTITGIFSVISGNDIILNVTTDKNPTGFETVLTDALKDIVGDISNLTFNPTSNTLEISMSTGTVEEVVLTGFAEIGDSYTKAETDTLLSDKASSVTVMSRFR